MKPSVVRKALEQCTECGKDYYNAYFELTVVDLVDAVPGKDHSPLEYLPVSADALYSLFDELLYDHIGIKLRKLTRTPMTTAQMVEKIAFELDCELAGAAPPSVFFAQLPFAFVKPMIEPLIATWLENEAAHYNNEDGTYNPLEVLKR